MNAEKVQNYLRHQVDYREKWKKLMSMPQDFDLSHRRDALIPFSGTPLFQELTEEQKNSLFVANIQFIAETIIIFEQILLYHYYKHRNKKHYIDTNDSAPWMQFTADELYHSMAFRHFLKAPLFQADPRPLILDCRWLKKAFTFVVKYFPGALFICSPRVEAFTLTYYTMIKEVYGHQKNGWLNLHHLHYQDEIYHIPLSYHFHDAFVEKLGAVKTLIGSALFLGMMQVMLIKVSTTVVIRGLPEKTGLERLRYILKFLGWTIKISPAHAEARRMMRNQFKKINPKYSHAFSFISW